ncbi:uncharacterized protein LOC130796506 isoform X1 [Actinidia eriantha]|uniref:uncharacterized protein LOC130796506 isoform X1 n=1 Tax=Actinidia eriantha TaxID=165200 RepID=UPI00258FB292|nr:uncharacterized protein LOC130796506 isoform X1 [Actinidia eriantha]XP_057514860.1 uncharacterized protein LOC130796506 isoform X1 [Actinidia eriantha]
MMVNKMQERLKLGLKVGCVQIKSNNATAAAPVDPPLLDSLDYQPHGLGIGDRRTGQFSSCPKNSELQIADSSAFFQYVKSSKSNVPVDVDAPLESRIENKVNECSGRVDNDTQNKQDKRHWKTIPKERTF